MPVGSIIIGTHIIQLNVLNQEILDAASKSAEQSSQSNVYYKSEFSDGTWYDITTASSIDDISKKQNNAVANSTIDKLKLTHWTKADGVTIEFSTGRRIGIQDIDNISDPNNIPELEELKTEKGLQQGMYDNEKDDDKKDSIGYVVSNISSLFSLIESKELDDIRKYE